MVDEEIPKSEESKIPSFLYLVYILVFFGGLLAFILFWNGSKGWLDRGFWQKLQQAASTTYPYDKK